MGGSRVQVVVSCLRGGPLECGDCGAGCSIDLNIFILGDGALILFALGGRIKIEGSEDMGF